MYPPSTGSKSLSTKPEMLKDQRIHSESFTYLINHAPVLFFVLSEQGVVIDTNGYADHVAGCPLTGKNFQEIIVDFTGKFDFPALISDPPHEQLINIGTASRLPQSYYFVFRKLPDCILAFGRLDIEEIGSMRKEILSLNHELNNFMRELHKKNAILNQVNEDLQAANQKIEELARTDSLTQLVNRRYFDERIRELTFLSIRKFQPLSVIMTDIDKFKQVNDTFGHFMGDRVLIGYADLMKKHTRAEDIVARYGGEEFIILLQQTDDSHAILIAERIRKSLSIADLLNNTYTVTASFGISQLKTDESVETFIKRADIALYRAKQSGRNRSSLAE